MRDVLLSIDCRCILDHLRPWSLSSFLNVTKLRISSPLGASKESPTLQTEASTFEDSVGLVLPLLLPFVFSCLVLSPPSPKRKDTEDTETDIPRCFSEHLKADVETGPQT